MREYTHKTKDGRRCRIVCTDRIAADGLTAVAILEPQTHGYEVAVIIHPEALTPISPYDDWPHEARILVWVTGSSQRFRGRFAGINKYERPMAYAHGADKWGSNGETLTWDHAELWDADDFASTE